MDNSIGIDGYEANNENETIISKIAFKFFFDWNYKNDVIKSMIGFSEIPSFTTTPFYYVLHSRIPFHLVLSFFFIFIQTQRRTNNNNNYN